MPIIDRRLNPGAKNLPNRQRFLRRLEILQGFPRLRLAGRGARRASQSKRTNAHLDRRVARRRIRHPDE